MCSTMHDSLVPVCCFSSYWIYLRNHRSSFFAYMALSRGVPLFWCVGAYAVNTSITLLKYNWSGHVRIIFRNVLISSLQDFTKKAWSVIWRKFKAWRYAHELMLFVLNKQTNKKPRLTDQNPSLINKFSFTKTLAWLHISFASCTFSVVGCS